MDIHKEIWSRDYFCFNRKIFDCVVDQIGSRRLNYKIHHQVNKLFRDDFLARVRGEVHSRIMEQVK